MNKKDWIWMPHAAHHICRARCQFRLATYVGGYIVSSVGEFLRERGDTAFDTVGSERLYETIVFKAKKSGVKCCPYVITDAGNTRDFKGYNKSSAAIKGHMELCDKWSKIKEGK